MGILQPILGPICGPILRGIADKAVGRPSLSAFSAAKFAIQQNTSDLNILVIGDSTGDATNEWVYLFGQWLADQYTTHSVSYRLWDDANNVYASAISLSAAGANTIRIWNASVAGKGALYLIGSKQSSLGVDANLVLFSHGKNSQKGLTTQQRRAENMMGWEQARLLNPNAFFAAVLQCPNRDDDVMSDVVNQQTFVASQYPDCGVLDVHSAFVARNKDASLYLDNFHPSAAGSAVWVGVIEGAWLASPASPRINGGALLSVTTTNLLLNGDFADFTGTLPASWSATASPTATKDPTIVDGESTYSVKLTGTAAGARIQNYLGTIQRNIVKGNSTTLAVRQFVPAESADSVGRIGIIVDSPTLGSIVTTSASFIEGKGGWRWVIVSGVEVPLDATNVRAFLYCDSSANAGSAINYDRAVLVPDDLPRDMDLA